MPLGNRQSHVFLLYDEPYNHHMDRVVKVENVFNPFTMDKSPLPIICYADEQTKRRSNETIFK